MTNIKFVITAATPDECRQEIVKWLNQQAVQYSSQARIVKIGDENWA